MNYIIDNFFSFPFSPLGSITTVNGVTTMTMNVPAVNNIPSIGNIVQQAKQNALRNALQNIGQPGSGGVYNVNRQIGTQIGRK